MTKITLLDGGMGQELVARSGDAPTPLWSTQVMIDHPGLVRQVHEDYFRAGASVATTNTYAIHRDRLVKAGIEDRFAALHTQALAEAAAARAAHGSGRIAASLGPLVASYRPDTHPPHAEAVAKYDEIAMLLAPAVDILLAETVASLDHARAILEGAAGHGRPVWLSVTVDDEDGSRLRSGEQLAELGPFLKAGGAAAVLANCSAPEAMAAALEVLGTFGLPFGAYANGFQQITKEFLKDSPTVDALQARPEMTPALYADFAMRWVGMGATIIGGCCETTPAHIAEIAERLRAGGHAIV
ncbi:homocysteine S-methyltransferase family protein [Defluviimonas sp. WL0002]|uniref:Homocysteine S-methyltransferase family protein n=1 Tax=Albidovulum marisflavi TaxID=2984159 RepID=A0ABT2Z812_9RHOB|nr:homocysteine S-methyltransferase family protein [Defluviimonas sp. WL0002]MCV2867228.1 homocysteine S-methyltransferase family protein [Defluviimonas sp. WL0002]